MMRSTPLLRKIDAVTVPVPDLDSGLRFYRDHLGHELLWRNDRLGQAGLGLPDSDAEIVLATGLGLAPAWLVPSAGEAAADIVAAGGRMVAEPSEIPVGRVAVVASSAVALPVFAFMSAGVSLAGAGGFWASTVTWGVLAGLLAGKFVGIFGVSWVTARFTGAHLNPRLGWADVAGVGVLGGIGFTVSLLIAELSYAGDARLTEAKGAILLASAVASLLAVLVLGRRSRHHRLARRRPAPDSAA